MGAMPFYLTMIQSQANWLMLVSATLHLSGTIVRGDGLTAIKLWLSFLLSVLLQPVTSTSLHIAILSCTVETSNLSQFCSVQSVGMSITTDASDSNAFLQQYMKTHIRIQSDGTYCLRFTLRHIHSLLPSNYIICSKWTKSLAHWLAKTPELLKMYGVILRAHTTQHHGGVNATLTVIQQSYWIPSTSQFFLYWLGKIKLKKFSDQYEMLPKSCYLKI